MFQDKKWVFRTRKLKDKQYNGKKKKDELDMSKPIPSFIKI